MKYKLKEFLEFNPKETLPKGRVAKKIPMEFLNSFSRDILKWENEVYSGGAKFRNDDTIMARITPCLENGKRAKINILDDGEIAFGSTEYIVFRSKPGISDPDFIYYLICSDLIRNPAIKSMVGSSGRQRVQVDVLENLELELPDINLQRKIGIILKVLDDKIILNTRINNNLEQQAQALFKSWFVDFEPFGGKMPSDWKEYKLDDLTSKFGTGLNPRKNFVLGHGNNYYVTIKNMANNRIYLDDRCDKIDDEAILKINKRSKLQRGDLLFSGIGTIGRVALITENPTNWNTSESVFNMHPCENISSEFLYVLLLSEQFQSYVNVHKQGGVQQGIRMASLKDFKISLPSYNVIHSFDNLIVPMISTIKNKEKENDNLAQLRDTLLPKLMSGEIDVSKVNVDDLTLVDKLSFTKE